MPKPQNLSFLINHGGTGNPSKLLTLEPEINNTRTRPCKKPMDLVLLRGETLQPFLQFVSS